MEGRAAATRRRIPVGSVVKLAFAAVAAVVALLETREQARHLVRRIRRMEAQWWAEEEHRERSALHEAELGFLARRGLSEQRSPHGRATEES